MKCCLFLFPHKRRISSDSPAYSVTNYASDNTEEYRRLQLVAEVQPAYGVAQGGGERERSDGGDLSSRMGGLSLGGEQRGEEGETIVRKPVPALGRAARE